MKKFISIICSVLLVISVLSFFLYTYTLNYKYQPDVTTFEDVITGYKKSMTSIGKYEEDYFNLLNSCTYQSLNYFEASALLLTSNNVQTITFASSKYYDSEEYPLIFFLGTVVLKDDKTFLYVAYTGDDGLAHTVFEITDKNIKAQINVSDLEYENLISDTIQSSFGTLTLLTRKYGIIFTVITTVIILSIVLLKKTTKR